MIARYTRPGMGAVWTDERRLGAWLEVELAATDAHVALGVVPADDAAAIREKARVDVARAKEILSYVKNTGSYSDSQGVEGIRKNVARFIEEFIQAPRVAEVYNIGGGKENSVSILEAFDLIAKISGKPMKYKYVAENRIGDHICYYSDLRKMKEHYPNWDITKSLEDVFHDIYNRYMEA